jgi:hypothetical protein
MWNQGAGSSSCHPGPARSRQFVLATVQWWTVSHWGLEALSQRILGDIQ